MPAHLVGEEFSEWFRLRAIPAIEAACRQHFHRGSPWFKAYKYNKLKAALGSTGDKPCFLVSQDSDTRHHCSDMWEYRRVKATGKPASIRDRRTLPRGVRGWIDISLDNYVPTAKRVPDCIQSPIEMLFSGWKREARNAYKQRPDNGWKAWVECIEHAFHSWVAKQSLVKFFEHAEIALQVFSGTEDQTVTVPTRHGQIKIHCTHGDWVPKIAAG